MKREFIFSAVVAVWGVSGAWAQEPTQPAMPGMDHSQMDHGKMGHGAKKESAPAGQDMSGMDHGSMSGMGGMEHGSMQGGSPPPDARDPNAYAEGYGFGPLPRMRMADQHNFGSLLVNRLERVRTRDNSYSAYDLQAWYGRDYDRLVFKAEGEVDNGKSQEARTELLWGHAIATFWNSQLGVRYDGGQEPSRNWLAFGVQGLAPYWFEVDVTGYLGENGRTALRVESEYELLLTQRLVLQPRLEANFFGKRDPARETGSGLSDLSVGVRLRYEIRREFAPYLGVEWGNKFGGTADFARADGKRTSESRIVGGVRFWF